MRTRRFFLPEWEERQRDAAALCLVGGGCEWCAPDFVVDRHSFPYLAFEFVSKGRGSVTLADQTHELEAGHAFVFGPDTPHVIRSAAEEPMVKYFFNFTGQRAAQLMSDLDLSPGSVLRVMDSARVVSLLEEAIDECRLAVVDVRDDRDIAELHLNLLVCCAARHHERVAMRSPAPPS